MKFIVSEKSSSNGKIIVVTDSEIIGKKFEEKNLQLDITSAFYNGEEMEEEQTKELMKKGYIIHLTGKNSVTLGINMDFVYGKNVITVDKIPHAEVIIDTNMS